MNYRIIAGREPKYVGPCVVCSKNVKPGGLLGAVLLKDTFNRFGVCHLECCSVEHTIHKEGFEKTRKIVFARKDFMI